MKITLLALFREKQIFMLLTRVFKLFCWEKCFCSNLKAQMWISWAFFLLCGCCGISRFLVEKVWEIFMGKENVCASFSIFLMKPVISRGLTWLWLDMWLDLNLHFFTNLAQFLTRIDRKCRSSRNPDIKFFIFKKLSLAFPFSIFLFTGKFCCVQEVQETNLQESTSDWDDIFFATHESWPRDP